MSLNSTPSADRIHIGIFGKRNAGKSSIINAITGQSLAIVSDIKGTTTDPVLKAMELLPLGPVVLIDTPGLDDEGELGALRIRKAYQMLNKSDIALLIVDASVGMTAEDAAILARIQGKQIPYLIVLNKADLCTDCDLPEDFKSHVVRVSAATQDGIHELKEQIGKLLPDTTASLPIIRDLLHPNDLAVLVVPIDSAAPKGRLILPQQQTIRDILEAGAIAVVTRDIELAETLTRVRPKVVITDSQAFEQVARITPEDITLTSFSILMARHKGNLDILVDGARALDTLEDGDHILISEGCTHHRQCEDIGTVKLPNWLRKHSGKTLHFTFTSGVEFPEDLSPYRLIIHCGGCTLNEREMKYRIRCACDQHVPITNYGTAIAHMKGILARSLEIFELGT